MELEKRGILGSRYQPSSSVSGTPWILEEVRGFHLRLLMAPHQGELVPQPHRLGSAPIQFNADKVLSTQDVATLSWADTFLILTGRRHQASSAAPLRAQWSYISPNTMEFNQLVSRVLQRLELNTILKITFKTANRHTHVRDMPNVNHHRPHKLQVSVVIPTSKYRLSCQHV